MLKVEQTLVLFVIFFKLVKAVDHNGFVIDRIPVDDISSYHLCVDRLDLCICALGNIKAYGTSCVIRL